MHFETLTPEYVSKLAAYDEETARHFHYYFGRLLRIKLRSRRLADAIIQEVCQETFLRVLVALNKGALRDPSRLGPFVNSTCNHVLSEHYRRNSRSSPLEPEQLENLSEPARAERAMIDDQAARQVHEILATMPTRDRGILQAVFIEERDKDEVCSDYGVDRNYLRVLLHRAKNNFRDRFPKQ